MMDNQSATFHRTWDRVCSVPILIQIHFKTFLLFDIFYHPYNASIVIYSLCATHSKHSSIISFILIIQKNM